MTTVEYDYSSEVNSSAVDKIYYDNATRQLFVQFPSGGLAGYKDIAPETIYKFANADSIGKFYAKNIRGMYKGINTSDIELVKRGLSQPEGIKINKANYLVRFAVTIEIAADNIFQAISEVQRGNPSAEIYEASIIE